MLDHLKSLLKTEGVWLAGIPLVCLLLSLAYETGYSLHFGYPQWTLSADLSTILFSLLRVLFQFSSFVSLYYLTVMFLNSHSTGFRLLGGLMADNRYMILIATTALWTNYTWIVVLSGFGTTIGIYLWLTYFFVGRYARRYRTVKSFWRRFRITIRENARTSLRTIDGLKSNKRGLLSGLFLSFRCFAFAMAWPQQTQKAIFSSLN